MKRMRQKKDEAVLEEKEEERLDEDRAGETNVLELSLIGDNAVTASKKPEKD